MATICETIKHVLTPVICTEPGCITSGVAYVSAEDGRAKPHYCIIHNKIIQSNRVGA